MNDIRDLLPAGLSKGSLMDALEGVHEVYARGEAAMDEFRRASALSCPDGCGTCCETFVPDITDLEAAYLAAWFVRHMPERAHALAHEGFTESERASGRCPLHRADDAAHCTVYAGRPLICRLFGFAASRAKDGRPAFALCRSMPQRSDNSERTWKGDAIAEVLGAIPPAMADLGASLASIRPSEGSRRLLIDALPDALRRVLFLASFATSQDSDGLEPEPQTPMPIAG